MSLMPLQLPDWGNDPLGISRAAESFTQGLERGRARKDELKNAGTQRTMQAIMGIIQSPDATINSRIGALKALVIAAGNGKPDPHVQAIIDHVIPQMEAEGKRLVNRNTGAESSSKWGVFNQMAPGDENPASLDVTTVGDTPTSVLDMLRKRAEQGRQDTREDAVRQQGQEFTSSQLNKQLLNQQRNDPENTFVDLKSGKTITRTVDPETGKPTFESPPDGYMPLSQANNLIRANKTSASMQKTISNANGLWKHENPDKGDLTDQPDSVQNEYIGRVEYMQVALTQSQIDANLAGTTNKANISQGTTPESPHQVGQSNREEETNFNTTFGTPIRNLVTAQRTAGIAYETAESALERLEQKRDDYVKNHTDDVDTPAYEAAIRAMDNDIEDTRRQKDEAVAAFNESGKQAGRLVDEAGHKYGNKVRIGKTAKAFGKHGTLQSLDSIDTITFDNSTEATGDEANFPVVQGITYITKEKGRQKGINAGLHMSEVKQYAIEHKQTVTEVLTEYVHNNGAVTVVMDK